MTENSRESHIQHNDESPKKPAIEIGETNQEQRYAHRDITYQIDSPKPMDQFAITHDKTSGYQMDLQNIHKIKKI